MDRGAEALVLRACVQINITGGTEVGGCILIGTTNHPMNPGSFSRKALGMGADIVDISGRRMPTGEVGELVLRNASIGMTKSLWKDDQRYLDSYWNTIPGLWVHGDFAMEGRDGLFYILGRSDDTIKVSGKRTGPAELEGILIGTGKLAEAAVFSIPHPVKGSAILCAWVLLVDDLPRTRNMKIMRRVLRAVLEDKDRGDLSALANPEAVDALRAKIAAS